MLPLLTIVRTLVIPVVPPSVIVPLFVTSVPPFGVEEKPPEIAANWLNVVTGRSTATIVPALVKLSLPLSTTVAPGKKLALVRVRLSVPRLVMASAVAVAVSPGATATLLLRIAGPVVTAMSVVRSTLP